MKSVLVNQYSCSLDGLLDKKLGQNLSRKLSRKSEKMPSGFMVWLVCALLLLNLFQSTFANAAMAHSHHAEANSINHDALLVHNDKNTTLNTAQADFTDKDEAHCHSQMLAGDSTSNMTTSAANYNYEHIVVHSGDHSDDHKNGHSVEINSECCGEDCQCSTQHCFGSTVALLHPVIFTTASPLRTLALTAAVGARVHTTSSQFRPPKNLLTA
jgi:hypothetical protein